MKFAIVVYGPPYTSEATHSALHFARAAIDSGNEIYRVFFYHDGVYNGNAAVSPPQDEQDIHNDWSAFANDHGIELIVCIASSLRRGMLDDTEASRYEKSASTIEPPFRVSGLGQLIDAGLNADRVVTFGV